MKIGMIGLGRMGGIMSERLLAAGHEVVAFDPRLEAVERLSSLGALGAASVATLARQLEAPRAIWMMLPAGNPVEETIDALIDEIDQGDIVIDGGNSYYRDSMRRAERLAQLGAHFIDVGTSGGIWGLTEGFSLMVGGKVAAVEQMRPIFEALACDQGWGRVGSSGAGHFTKMIHNGIEYGMMQALVEGLAIIRAKESFALDLEVVTEIWRHGSVVRSWLLDLSARAIRANPNLEGIEPLVADSGEGRWAVAEAIELNVPAPVITTSLIERIASRDQVGFGHRLLAALRAEFGGHAIKRSGGDG